MRSNTTQLSSLFLKTERTFHVDGTSYIIRGLKPTEIDDWAEFCASVFAYKNNSPPRSYFSRHFIADPDRQGSSWIRVALVDDGKQIVASCRVLFRRVSVGDEVTTGAGIGEVCTDVAHRRRGLSTQLLMDAFSIMNSGSFDFSFLHASETFFKFYRSVGYSVSAVSRWCTAHIDRHFLATRSDHSSRIRPACFPQDADQLMKLHQQYTEQRVRGSIVRSRDYWVDYVSEELKGNLHVLYKEQNSGEQDIIGWLSLRLRDGNDDPATKMQLREFGCANPERNCYSILVQLLNYAVADLSKNEEISPCFRLHFPEMVYEDVRRSCAVESLFTDVSQANDQGWMYKPLANPDVLSQIVVPDSHHFIWPTDSF